jgi:hypothetical protein
MLCEFAFANNMIIIIMSTQFQHKQIYEATWISPDETTLNQIDHLFVNADKNKISQNIRSMGGPNMDSSHFFQKVIIKQKLLIIYRGKSPTLPKMK